jgi:hypothetical protein
VKIRRKAGVIRVDAQPAEATLLGALLDDLTALLADADADAGAWGRLAGGGRRADSGHGDGARDGDGDGDGVEVDPALQRLFPNGYTDDEDASAEFRELVVADLMSDRIARLAQCRAELPVAGGRFALDDEAADRWIRVLNDLRLTIGVRIGVTEEEELDPRQESTALYQWLSVVQELLVEQLIG